jgi:NAD(P)-dependent dehydrogenase (short-subunit alcohol dehydrogenase family)
MQPTLSHAGTPSILLVAASRGLGLAMAEQFLNHGWHVTGTVRAGSGRSKLHDLAERVGARLDIETLDICEPAQLARCARACRGGASTCCSSTRARATIRPRRSAKSRPTSSCA